MDYHNRSGDTSRTPMAWQHRDLHHRDSSQSADNLEERFEAYDGRRGRYKASSTPGGGAPRYGGPGTPNSSRSRNTRTPDQRRGRETSSERYSHHSGRRVPSRDSRDGRGGPGSRSSRANSYRGFSRSHQSPSSTEETTEETTETDSQSPDKSDYQRQRQMYPPPGYAFPIGYPSLQPQIMGPIAPPQLIMAPNGSVRSIHSVPMLAAPGAPTWDGEPCPVHHQPSIPLAAIYGIGPPPPHPALSMGPTSVPPSVISGATTVRRARSEAEISNGGFSFMPPPGTPHMDRKSFHGSMHHLVPNGALVRAPSRLVVGENGTPSHLPVRDSKGRHSPLPRKSDKDKGLDCCSGHFVVVWIIMGVITFAILLVVILKFTIA